MPFGRSLERARESRSAPQELVASYLRQQLRQALWLGRRPAHGAPSTHKERYPRISRVAGRLFEGEEAVLHVMG
jgi:hypothetical protein